MSEAAAPLKGRVALVAGGYGGIGEACARALVAQGAATVIAGPGAGRARGGPLIREPSGA